MNWTLITALVMFVVMFFVGLPLGMLAGDRWYRARHQPKGEVMTNPFPPTRPSAHPEPHEHVEPSPAPEPPGVYAYPEPRKGEEETP